MIRFHFILMSLFLGLVSEAQITAGKITFERKTNLYKSLKGQDVKDWLKEADKIKTDYFELIFNDSCSLFKPQESELREKMEWTTNKNIVYQNLNTGKRYVIKNFWGEELHMTDSLYYRTWKITESSRKIAGYNCRKAIWQPNDSTHIYAWFSYDITASTGPETFNGLPGTILGVATEDGGIIYFAKKVEIYDPEASIFVTPKKKKTYSTAELQAELEKRWGKEKWFRRIYESNFGYW
jgi:GLPGLI family protein